MRDDRMLVQLGRSLSQMQDRCAHFITPDCVVGAAADNHGWNAYICASKGLLIFEDRASIGFWSARIQSFRRRPRIHGGMNRITR